MLRYLSFDIVFQEVPGEVTLAVNLSGCPNRCPGCHSPHLQENVGETFDENRLSALLKEYGNAVTCICFMGGDADPDEIARLAKYVKNLTCGILKTAWYSGRPDLPCDCNLQDFDYIKLGAYIKELGGLDCASTNQRFYKIANGQMEDITIRFRKPLS